MKFHKGDRVNHACGSSRGDMHAKFSHYIEPAGPNDERRVSVIYTSAQKWGKKGDWLAKYCVKRELFKLTKYLKEMDFSEVEKRVTSHITDPVNHGRMIIDSTLHNKADWFKQMYMNGHPDAIRGTEIHKAFFDEINWPPVFGKHDDFVDSATYMAFDLAKSLDPKLNPEYTVKAIITELYVDGILTETKINDRNIEELGTGDLLGYIGNANAAIEKLTKHDGSKCKFIGQEMKRLTNFIDSVYVLLDQKAGNPPKI